MLKSPQSLATNCIPPTRRSPQSWKPLPVPASDTGLSSRISSAKSRQVQVRLLRGRGPELTTFTGKLAAGYTPNIQ